MGKKDFDQLLKQSTQLENSLWQHTNISEPPIKIHRELSQIYEESTKMVQRTERRNENQRHKAQILLSSQKSNFNPDTYQRSLNAINLKATFEPLEDILPTDIQSYLSHEHELIVLSVLEETKKDTIKRSEENFESCLQSEWQETKRMIAESGSRRWLSNTTSKANQLVLSQTINEDKLLTLKPQIQAFPNNQNIDEKMTNYAKVIYQLNSFRKSEKPFALVSAFKESIFLGKQKKGDEDLEDSWTLLQYIVGEENVRGGEFHLQEEYYSNQNEKDLRKQFLRGSKKFLESQYLRHIKKQIASKPLEAMIGPNPSFKNTIRAYCKIFLKNQNQNENLEIINDIPIWAMVYFCMRVGKIKEAEEVINEAMNTPNSKLQQTCHNAPKYFQEYIAHQRLSDNTWRELNQEFNIMKSRQKSDPYKLVVYNILGKCAPKKSFSDVIKYSEDFFWFKLSLIRENEEALPDQLKQNDFKLEDLTQIVNSNGPNYFSQKGRKPHQYFRALIYTQQFDQAIKYLYGIESCSTEAAHFALALYYYGIIGDKNNLNISSLNTSLNNSSKSPIESETIRLIQHYISSFQNLYPLDALQYLAIIHKTPTSIQGFNSREIAIVKLILETHEFDLLLGDGQKPGAINEILDKEQCQRVLKRVIEESEMNGKYEDAIHLSILAEDYNKALDIINNQLSRVLATKGDERKRMSQWASLIWQKQKTQNVSFRRNDHAQATFEILFKLVHFYNLYFDRHYHEALKHMEELELIPFSVDPNVMEVKVKNFKLLDNCIKRNFADILIHTMECISECYQSLSHSLGGAVEKKEQLKIYARALIMFSGMISFRMPGDTQSRLIRYTTFMA